MSGARFKLPDAVELPSGEVLVAGSDPTVELYDPVTESFKTVEGGVGIELSYSTATVLPSGRVLIAGGYDNRIRVSDEVWMYREN
jgi:WD40 repeat protein